MSDPQDRRDWLFPPSDAVVDGVELGWLDPHDEGQRRLLLFADHPELAPAIEDGDDQIVLDGVEMSPTLHITMHDIVANRILDQEDTQWWGTAQRLVSLGYDRHEVLHMLCNVVSDEVYAAMNGETPAEPAGALAALPESWEAMRPPPRPRPNPARSRGRHPGPRHRPH